MSTRPGLTQTLEPSHGTLMSYLSSLKSHTFVYLDNVGMHKSPCTSAISGRGGPGVKIRACSRLAAPMGWVNTRRSDPCGRFTVHLPLHHAEADRRDKPEATIGGVLADLFAGRCVS